MWKTALTALGVVISILGIVGALYDLDDKLAEDFPPIAPYVEHIEVVFIALLAIVSLTLFVLLASGSMHAVRQMLDRMNVLHVKLSHFSCEKVKADDIPTLMSIYEGNTSGNTTESAARRIYGSSRVGWRKIVDTRDDKIVGYFLLLPLTKKGVEAIQSNEFRLNRETSKDWFCNRRASSGPAYIGMIGALKSAPGSRAFALKMLRNMANNGKYTAFYARPISRDGVRLVKDQGFVPVDPDGKLELDALCKKVARNARMS